MTEDLSRLQELAQTEASAAAAMIPLVIRRGDSLQSFIDAYPQHPLLQAQLASRLVNMGAAHQLMILRKIPVEGAAVHDFFGKTPVWSHGHFYHRTEGDFVFLVGNEVFQSYPIRHENLLHNLDDAQHIDLFFKDHSITLRLNWDRTFVRRLWLLDCFEAKILDTKGKSVTSLSDLHNARFPKVSDVVVRLKKAVEMARDRVRQGEGAFNLEIAMVHDVMYAHINNITQGQISVIPMLNGLADHFSRSMAHTQLPPINYALTEVYEKAMNVFKSILFEYLYGERT